MLPCFFGGKVDLWLVLMLPFSGAPLNVRYALRFFFCLIIMICSFLSQTKHVLGQQPSKDLAIIICKCGSNSLIAAFHNSQQCSRVNKQGTVRHTVVDGSQKQFSHKRLSSRYKTPWSQGNCFLCQLMAFWPWPDRWCPFLHWQNTPFCGALFFLWSRCWMQSTWKNSGDAVPQGHGASLCAGRFQQKTENVCTESYIGQALVWWLYFEWNL